MNYSSESKSSQYPVQSRSLYLTDVSLAFGGIKALDEVSFEVKPATIQAIIGPNGAGKTTLLNCISGQYEPEGSIRYGETELKNILPHRRIHLGIARTFQNIAVFPEQTVLDNVMAGGHHRLKGGLIRQSIYWRPFGCADEEEKLHFEAMAILEKLELKNLAEIPAGKLAYGQQKRLELGRAMMAQPGLLLLDEPMAGMSPAEKKDLSDLVKQINRDHGITIIMIEHDMTVVRAVSHRMVVLDFGKKISEGSPDEVVADQRVRKAYLGEED